MTTLSSALSFALSGLSVTAGQSATVSQNITLSGSETYSRRSVDVVTAWPGTAGLSAVRRQSDGELLRKLTEAISDHAGQQVSLNAWSRLGSLVGDPEAGTSVSAYLSGLQQALQDYRNAPSDLNLARSAINAASSLAGKLNASADEVLAIRTEADQAIAASVEHTRSLLDQFKIVNDAIVRGSNTSADLSDDLDRRDEILRLISEEIGIRTVTRARNDIAIFTDGGSVLFEGSPRSIGFSSTKTFDETTVGSAVTIDGTPVTGPLATMPASGGRIVASAAIRDDIAMRVLDQIDTIASRLVRSFAEEDQTQPPGLPAVQGLFTLASDPSVPAEGTFITGAARRIGLNALAAKAPSLLRDGGFGGNAYHYNTENLPGFQGRIGTLLNELDQPEAVSAQLGIGAEAAIGEIGLHMASWIESGRQSAQTDSDVKSASRAQASDALLRITGVNVDMEMAKLLDLEKSYQASSKVLTIVDAMLARLLDMA